jgi:hypothetical protein
MTMKVIIVRAGEVGFHIASRIACSNKDVVLIERILMKFAGFRITLMPIRSSDRAAAPWPWKRRG